MKRSKRGLPLDANGMDRKDRQIAAQKEKRKAERESTGQADIRHLRAEVDRLRKVALDHAVIRDQILRITHGKPPVPAWTISAPKSSKGLPGVPTLFLSDLHWGEVVDPKQIGGVNAYSLKVARERLRLVVANTVELLRKHMVNPRYPGIVLCLGGDMLSGNIHDELAKSNEKEVMPCLLDLIGAMIWAIQTLADEFGSVFIPCVTGNHGRNTLKMQAKERHHTNFDWLLYQFLDKHFESDPRVTFLIPDGTDAYFRVYSHRYLLTHGDQFRGGDGMIGMLGPVTRGDHKKRSRNAQIGQDYDTLLIGHWHQLIQMQRMIANGSLKGYDEYAYQGNFPFEAPRQACWITHPERGITFQMPIQAAPAMKREAAEWVSVPKGRVA